MGKVGKQNLRLAIRLILMASSLFMNVALAKHNGNTTPTKYLLTISNVAFHRVGDPASTFIQYATGTGQYDIASVSPNANVGVLTATGTLPEGTYDQVQLTVNKTMSVLASNPALSDGKPCRTDSANTVLLDPFHDGSLDKAYLGSRDGGAAQLESITVPTGSKMKPPPDMTDLGPSFKGTLPVNFMVTSTSPTITLKFDVTNATFFYPDPLDGTKCFVFPDAPSITITST